MGDGASVTGSAGIALGSGAEATGNLTTAIGVGAASNGVTGIALGTNAVNTVDNSVALGANAFDSAAFSKTTAGTTTYNSSVINGTTYNYAGGAPIGVVSVGSPGAERRIQNLAAGQISATSTDAVNGSQLYAVGNSITSTITAGQTHYYSVNDGGTQGPLVSAQLPRARAVLPRVSARLRGKKPIIWLSGLVQARRVPAPSLLATPQVLR